MLEFSVEKVFRIVSVELVLKMVGQEMWTFGLINFFIIGLSFGQVTNVPVESKIKASEESSLSSIEISGKQLKAFLSSSRSQKCHVECLKKVTTFGFSRVFGRVYTLNFRIFIHSEEKCCFKISKENKNVMNSSKC